MKLGATLLAFSCMLPNAKVDVKKIANLSEVQTMRLDCNRKVVMKDGFSGENKWPLISYIILSGDKSSLQALQKVLSLDGCDINIRSSRGRTPLMCAVVTAQTPHGLEVLDFLLHRKDLKINLNMQDDNGHSALMMAVATSSKYGTATSMLLEAGADPFLQSKKGETAWSLAVKASCTSGNMSHVLLFLKFLEPHYDVGDLLEPFFKMLCQGVTDDSFIMGFVSTIRVKKSAISFFKGGKWSLGASVSGVLRYKLMELVAPGAECVICMDPFEHRLVESRIVDFDAPVILACGHFFHPTCLQDWEKACPQGSLRRGEVICPTCKVKQFCPK